MSVRTFLFYVGFVLATAVWGSLSILVAWVLPLKVRFRFVIGPWTRVVLWWLRVTCGITMRIDGEEHLPDAPCVFLVKHQSTWETIWTQTLASPQATLVKRELLYIPIWGWAFGVTRPIAIDRKSPREAFKQLLEQGSDRLRRGMWVTLFPEGTRAPVGSMGTFHRGGAALAVRNGVPVVVIAHDAGYFWPVDGFGKTPGEITVKISPPFYPDNIKAGELNELCQTWMVDAMHELDARHGSRHGD